MRSSRRIQALVRAILRHPRTFSTCKACQCSSSSSEPPRHEREPVTIVHYEDGYVVRSMTWTEMNDFFKHYLDVAIISKYDYEIPMKICQPKDGPLVGTLDGEIVSAMDFVRWSKYVWYGGAHHVLKKYRKQSYGVRLQLDALKHLFPDPEECKKLCLVGDSMKLSSMTEEMLQLMGGNPQGGAGKMYTEAKDWPQEVYDVPGIQIVKATDVDFDKLAKFDSECFAVPDSASTRVPFLKQWINIPDGKALVAMDRKLNIVGLGCRRPALQQNQHLIGPLYAVNEVTAHALLAHLSADVVGQVIHMGIRFTHPHAVQFAEKLGFQLGTEYLKVYVGPPFNDFRHWVFGITSFTCGSW